MRIETGMQRAAAGDDRKAGPGAAGTSAAREVAPRDEAPPRRGPFGRGRAGGDELEELARAAAALASPAPSGGPLGLHAPAEAPRVVGVEAAGAVDRMFVGMTREGCPEVRLTIGQGAWQGAELRLVAGARGVEATLVVPSEAARRVVEAQLADLAKALDGRGVPLSRCEVATRDEQRQREQAQARRQVRWRQTERQA